ncbi:hypothetical protein D6D15_08028 [Aureobasidium pullulans]|uniref:Uncharacterized protein n=1 Tax=Aureobasidium pullulans TaxID=5580 RepID=A0A4S9B0Y5_AURPU|nr:hypothetical protein D6D15_08028 [Aureobasidium pullulans]
MMFFRHAWAAGSLVTQTVWAVNNNYKWTVNSITVDSITSPEADTLTLFATVTQLGGQEIARKSVFLGDVAEQYYLTGDQINFDLEFSAPSTSNISIIWSLTNSANANHTFTDDLQQLSNGTKALADHADGILDGLSDLTTELLAKLSPVTLGTAIGATFGPEGALIGAFIGSLVDDVLGSIIDDVFGCDCTVASDAVVFLPGDLSLLPIPLTTTYYGSGGGIDCQESSYTISSTLTLLQANHDNVATSLQSTTNWTISLLDTDAPLDWKIFNVEDTLYSGRYPPQTWTPSGDTVTFWDTPWWATLFLSGLWNKTSNPTTEAYIVDYASNKTLRIPDTPFPVDRWSGGLVYTGSWSNTKHDLAKHYLDKSNLEKHELRKHDLAKHYLKKHDLAKHRLPNHDLAKHYLEKFDLTKCNLAKHDLEKYNLEKHDLAKHRLPKHDLANHHLKRHNLAKCNLAKYNLTKHDCF